jgi:hypothetical protein
MKRGWKITVRSLSSGLTWQPPPPSRHHVREVFDVWSLETKPMGETELTLSDKDVRPKTLQACAVAGKDVVAACREKQKKKKKMSSDPQASKSCFIFELNAGTDNEKRETCWNH